MMDAKESSCALVRVHVYTYSRGETGREREERSGSTRDKASEREK